MQVISTAIPDVLLLEPRVYGDARGFFFESYNQRVFEQVTGVAARFVQDSHSRSVRGVLRGLHYQIRQPQGKLLRAKYSMSQLICVGARPRLAAGSVSVFPPTASACCGYRPVLPTAFW